MPPTPSTTHLPSPPLRVLQTDIFYIGYLSAFYDKNKHLSNAPSKQQELTLLRDGFSAIHAIAPYINMPHIHTEYCILNNYHSQAAWSKEHGHPFIFQTEDWQDTLLRQRIEHFKPDVLYIADPLRYDANFLASLTHRPRMTIAWRAADIPLGTDWTGYDIILSALPRLLAYAKTIGAKDAIWFAPGMPNWIARAVAIIPQDIDVVFAGSISPSQHLKRLAFLEILAEGAQKYGFSLALHLACDPALITETIRPYVRPPVFGLEMHKTLRRGRIVVDTQGSIGLRRPDGSYAMDLAQGDTANMRLFEATGGGSMVLTEHMDGLHKLFEPEKEVATYKTPQEMVEKILYYLKHVEQREAIAAAGKARCLGEWNMRNRAKAFMDIVLERLPACQLT